MKLEFKERIYFDKMLIQTFKKIISTLLLSSYITLGIAGHVVVQIAIGFGTDPFCITQANNLPNKTTKHCWTQNKHLTFSLKNGFIDISEVPSQQIQKFYENVEIIPVQQVLFKSNSAIPVYLTRSPPFV